ncbi:MAG: hypothetical protein ACYTE6_12385 [Planctomycetota bacterium]|jgi:hypothetical protein
MKRIGIAAVAGGVVLFIWAYISWMHIPWHETGTLPDQGAVTAALSDAGTTSGIYEFPGEAEGETGEPEAEADGPESAGLLMYKAGGGAPLVIQLIIGLVLEVLVAAVAACLLTMAVPALPGFASRLGFVMLLGVFTVVGANLMNWNYMHYPFRFTLEAAADGLVGALLLGVVLAIIIKPYTDLGEIEDVSDVEAAAET